MNRQKLDIPWWLYPNVLSLDAPLVAVLWMHVFAKVWSLQYVESLLSPILALAVWVIYTVDRLIDVKLHGDKLQEARHQFHRRHRKVFMVAVIIAVITIVFLSLMYLQWSIIVNAMYPLFGLGMFFICSLFSQPLRRVSYTKNIIAGCTFAMGCVVGLLGLSSRNMVTTMMAPEMLCFATICVIHICAIDFWAKPQLAPVSDEEDAVEEWSLTMPLVILALFALLYKSKEIHQDARAFYDTIVVSAGMTYVLNRMHRKLSANFLRVAADLILIVSAALYGLIST